MKARGPDLPKGFVRMISPLLGRGLQDFLDAMEEPARRALRFSARGKPPSVAGLAEPVPWAEGAFYLSECAAPGAHPLHWAGAYYLQEPSAMAAVSALAPQKDEKVLDLCAAPGGKACFIADSLGEKGLLAASDPVPGRARELSRSVERMGLRNTVVFQETPERLSKAFPGYFDRVLADAPCSGEGMFRKDPAARTQWTEEAPAACAARQKDILNAAAGTLRHGGVLVYSTCTFNRLENEDVVLAFLKAHPDFELQPFSLPGLPPAEGGMLRIWPHQAGGEGHFVARMKKAGSVTLPGHYPSRAGLDDLPFIRAANRMLPDIVVGEIRADALLGGDVVMKPAVLPNLEGLRVLRLGLHIASVHGNTLRPAHALALGARARKTIPVSLEEADRYRRGEELEVDVLLSGFAAPEIAGWQLGWGKAVGGRLKNHYPKGLRRQGAAMDPYSG